MRHLAWHPSRATLPSGNNSGCGNITIGFLIILAFLSLLGKCSSGDNNYNSLTYSNNDDTTIYSDSSSSISNSYNTSSIYMSDNSSKSIYNYSTNNETKTEYVHGYYRKDGTYVHSYYRRPRK